MVNQKQIEKMPIIETKVFKSKDGNYMVHKTIITDIKPVKYYDMVLDSEPMELED